MGWLSLLLVGWAYLAVKLRGFRPPRAVEERRPREEGLAAGACVAHLPAVRVFVALLSCTLWIPSVYVVGTITHGAGLP